MDPNSYEAQRYAGRSTRNREDGSKYYRLITVDFTAKNMFGGRVPGKASVLLTEDPEDGCMVMDAILQ